MYYKNTIDHCPIIPCRSTYNSKAKDGIKIEPFDQYGRLFKNLKRRNEHVKFCGNSLNCQECGKTFKTQQSLVGQKKALNILRNTNAKFVKNVLRVAQNFQDMRCHITRRI